MKKILIILSIIFGILLTIIASGLIYFKFKTSKTDEIISKTIKAHQNVKSLTINSRTEENNNVVNSTITANKEPLFLKKQNDKGDGTLYFDNSFEYYSDEYTSDLKPKILEWKKEKITDEEKNTILNYFIPNESLMYANTYILTETDSTYELKAKSDSLTHILTIDKNTYLLKSDETIESEKKIKLEYSNYNSQIDTKLPEDVSNAKEE